MNETSYSFSWRVLLAVFIMLVCLFIAVRWDITPWLRHQLDTAIQQQHLDVKYASLERHGLHITLHDVQFKNPNMPQTLLLDVVKISPDILPLLYGKLVAHVHIQNDFMAIQSLLTFKNNQLNVQNLDASWDVARTQTWLSLPSPVHAQGQLHLEGALTVDVYSGIPQSADLTAHWQHAGGSMMSQQYPLGDYTLKANIIEKNIQWNMTGGKELVVGGEGSIYIANTPLPQWVLQGNIKVQALKNSPLATFLTTSERHLKLSGNMGHPQWRF